jgi:hypothetical protein
MFNAISVATHGSLFIRKRVAPIRALIVPERMFDRRAPRVHGVGICIEPALHSLEHMLMLPARDPAQRLTRRANLLHDQPRVCGVI